MSYMDGCIGQYGLIFWERVHESYQVTGGYSPAGASESRETTSVPPVVPQFRIVEGTNVRSISGDVGRVGSVGDFYAANDKCVILKVLGLYYPHNIHISNS